MIEFGGSYKHTSIASTILPITSAEPALFGVYVYAVDLLLSRSRALREFQKMLEDDHD